ncbi:MAG: caspase family protein [Acidobacteria bacterium]|nr:caspase family protein [Acidobacteriota bacterium]MBV9476280.1 caspase family protein [Acidobacteriota bacterium]
MSLKHACFALLCAVIFAHDAAAAPHKRALLVGINDYSASHLPSLGPAAPERDWPPLGGAVNDVEAMRQLLVALRGFALQDIVTLTDEAATRAAILRAIETQLVATAAEGDIVFFYYAGHGSQVRNSRSDEPDHLDESIVPADSRRGAPDIRDKELRRLFNRVLDRGARLTVMLDDCHSGSGARGLPTGAVARGIKPDQRDVADGADAGPRPESRGAVVIAASQDFEDAREKRDDRNNLHGAFTWGWMRAMRDAAPDESAFEMFLRTQARLRTEMPFQEPVFAATASARNTPFLGTRDERRSARGDERTRVAVAKLLANGNVLLQGGWANGLSAGSVLRVAGDPRTRVRVTALVGLGNAEARVEEGRVDAGTLLEPSGWLAAPARPLRVALPQVALGEVSIGGLARALTRIAAQRGLRWIHDPTATTPQYVLRRGNEQWELLRPRGASTAFTPDTDGAENAVRAVPEGASLFVQLPAPQAIVERLAIPPNDVANDPAEADYILTGRFVNGRLAYAWIRPGVTRADRRKSGLPVRSAWTSDAETLRDTALRLRRIAAWQLLDSPPAARSPYHLALRRAHDNALVHGTSVMGHERYQAVLRGVNLPPRVDGRFVYLFVIDSRGQSILLYPRAASGSVENRFPIDPSVAPPAEIPLCAFEVSPPYGVDTYVLLTTDQPLPNPSLLEWNGVRSNGTRPSTPLEELLASLGSSTRAVVTPSNWSIERTTWESTPQKRGGGV